MSIFSLIIAIMCFMIMMMCLQVNNKTGNICAGINFICMLINLALGFEVLF